MGLLRKTDANQTQTSGPHRAGKCWVCKRQARGFGHLDGRFKIADPRRYPLDWAFCSLRCQGIFHKLYGQWQASSQPQLENFMIDPTEMEITAMRSCLKSFGEAAEGIGFDKPLGAYSETEALQVIHAIVAAYVEAMTMAHEAMKHSARPNQQDYDPFDNFNDDLPWETK